MIDYDYLDVSSASNVNLCRNSEFPTARGLKRKGSFRLYFHDQTFVISRPRAVISFIVAVVTEQKVRNMTSLSNLR